MSKQSWPLKLEDIYVGQDIDVVDNLRQHGIQARVTGITTDPDGSITVEFIDTKSIRYAWRASAMGIVEGITSFWKVYRRGESPKTIRFTYLYSHGKQIA